MEFPSIWIITCFTDDEIRNGKGARENMGREMYGRRGRKEPWIRVPKGQEEGKIKGNYTAMLNILQSKKC